MFVNVPTQPQHGIKHLAAINNSKHWLSTVIAALCFILLVAVVEFGTHTPRYWSETYHGVSEVLKDLSYFNCFLSNIVKFSGDTVEVYHC